MRNAEYQPFQECARDLLQAQGAIIPISDIDHAIADLVNLLKYDIMRGYTWLDNAVVFLV